MATAKRTAAPRKAKKLEPTQAYLVELTIGDKTFTSSGDTLIEAFDAIVLGIDRHDLKAKAIFTVRHGGKPVTRLMYVWPLRRFYQNHLARQLWAKAFGL